MNHMVNLSDKADVFKGIIDSHPSKIAIYGNNGDFFYANTKYIKYYDIDLSCKENLNFNNIKACSFTFEHLKSKLLDKNSFSIQKQKDEIWLESIFFYSSTDYIIHIFNDITNFKKTDKENYYYANYDSLTKLLNRSSFNKKFEAMLSQAQKDDSKIALFFIDVDRFKEANDSYGHDVGDKILVAVARRLLNSVKKDDLIGRIGGDEFVLIAKNIKNIKDVESLALKLQNKIREPLNIDDKIFNITLSIGASIYPQHGTSRHDLLKNADIAMYEVKRSTRDNFKIYDQFMSNNIYTKLFMQNSVRKALKKDEFVMYYQPVINLHTNSIVGAEALVRWNKSKNNILEPANFLKFVLSGDMSKEFGDMVVSKVLQDLTLLNEVFSNKKLILSINISKEQLLNSAFSSEFISLFENYNITPSQIELEIFEVEIIQNSDIVKKNIENLSSIGFGIVFDNFGVGNSSLSFLRDIKVDKLKIDRSFIKNMIEDKKDLKIAKSIVDMAKLFDLKVQAEGVETKEQYIKLKNMGCDYSQGFYYLSAAPVHDFINFCNKI